MSMTAETSNARGEWVLVPLGQGADPRVDDDSFRMMVEAFQSHIGARRPGNDEPEDQWLWDKAQAFIDLVDLANDAISAAVPSPAAADDGLTAAYMLGRHDGKRSAPAAAGVQAASVPVSELQRLVDRAYDHIAGTRPHGWTGEQERAQWVALVNDLRASASHTNVRELTALAQEAK